MIDPDEELRFERVTDPDTIAAARRAIEDRGIILPPDPGPADPPAPDTAPVK